MDFTFLEGLLYAFVSGLAEFMPVSSAAHRHIMLKLFGMNTAHPMMDLFVHGGALFAVLMSCKNQIRKLQREDRLRKIPRQRRKRQPDPATISDSAFLKTACVPLLIGFLFYFGIHNWENALPLSAIFLLVNGLVLHIPQYFPTGNKDSRNMTRLDSLAFGALSVLGMIPGLSRIALNGSYAALRGADFEHTYKWSLLIMIPSLIALSIFDIIFLFSASYSGFGLLFVFQCILAAGLSWLGATLSINLMRAWVKNGLGGFSYYCWGAAMFAFILYLYA